MRPLSYPSLLAALMLSACASASNSTPPGAATHTPAPLCLPQDGFGSPSGVAHNTASGGWVVVQRDFLDRSTVQLVDPRTGHVLAIEALGMQHQEAVITASPDPALRVLCVSMRHYGPATDPTRPNTVGVWDLATHAWRWRETGTTADTVIAGVDHCLFGRDPEITVRAFSDGTKLSTNRGWLSGVARTIARGNTVDEPWILTRQVASSQNATSPYELYDGRTGRLLAAFHARCAVLDDYGLGVVWPDAPGDASAQKARARTEKWLGPNLHIVPDTTCGGLPDLTVVAADQSFSRTPTRALLIDDDRMLAHVDGGLFVWRWASEAPVLVHAGPPAQPRDANARRHPLVPALAPDGTWVGILGDDATLTRLALPGAPEPSVPLAPLPLPSLPLGDTAETAFWQASVGPADADGYPLAVIRDTSFSARTLYIGHTARPGDWKAVRKARLYGGLWQEIFWPAGAPGTVLIGETHFGPQVATLDGKHVARFPMTITSSRVEPFLVSDDRLFIGVDPVFDKPDGGLYVLGLPRLDRIERREWQAKPTDSMSHLATEAQWLADGRVVFIGRGARGNAGHEEWATVTPPPRAPGRQLVQHIRGDAWDLYDGEGTRIATLGLRDGGGWVEPPDGRVKCYAGGCSRYRTTLPDWTSVPATPAGCQVPRR